MTTVATNTTGLLIEKPLEVTQILVIAACSVVIAIFFFVAAFFRIRNCIKRHSNSGLLAKRQEESAVNSRNSPYVSNDNQDDHASFNHKKNSERRHNSDDVAILPSDLKISVNQPLLVITEPSTTNSPESSPGSQEDLWKKASNPAERRIYNTERSELPPTSYQPRDNPVNIVTCDKFMELSSGMEPLSSSPKKKKQFFDDFDDSIVIQEEPKDSIPHKEYRSTEELDIETRLLDFTAPLNDESLNHDTDQLNGVRPYRPGATGLTQSNTSIDSPPSYRYSSQSEYSQNEGEVTEYYDDKARQARMYDPTSSAPRKDRKSLPTLAGCEKYIAANVNKSKRFRSDSKPEVLTINEKL